MSLSSVCASTTPNNGTESNKKKRTHHRRNRSYVLDLGRFGRVTGQCGNEDSVETLLKIQFSFIYALHTTASNMLSLREEKNKQLCKPILNRIRIEHFITRTEHVCQSNAKHTTRRTFPAYSNRLRSLLYGLRSTGYHWRLLCRLSFGRSYLFYTVTANMSRNEFIHASCELIATHERHVLPIHLVIWSLTCSDAFPAFVYAFFLFIFGCEVYSIHPQRLWAPSLWCSQTFDASNYNESMFHTEHIPYWGCPIACRQRRYQTDKPKIAASKWCCSRQ